MLMNFHLWLPRLRAWLDDLSAGRGRRLTRSGERVSRVNVEPELQVNYRRTRSSQYVERSTSSR